MEGQLRFLEKKCHNFFFFFFFATKGHFIPLKINTTKHRTETRPPHKKIVGEEIFWFFLKNNQTQDLQEIPKGGDNKAAPISHTSLGLR
jgi:hypothetical protein